MFVTIDSQLPQLPKQLIHFSWPPEGRDVINRMATGWRCPPLPYHVRRVMANVVNPSVNDPETVSPPQAPVQPLLGGDSEPAHDQPVQQMSGGRGRTGDPDPVAGIAGTTRRALSIGSTRQLLDALSRTVGYGTLTRQEVQRLFDMASKLGLVAKNPQKRTRLAEEHRLVKTLLVGAIDPAHVKDAVDLARYWGFVLPEGHADVAVNDLIDVIVSRLVVEDSQDVVRVLEKALTDLRPTDPWTRGVPRATRDIRRLLQEERIAGAEPMSRQLGRMGRISRNIASRLKEWPESAAGSLVSQFVQEFLRQRDHRKRLWTAGINLSFLVEVIQVKYKKDPQSKALFLTCLKGIEQIISLIATKLRAGRKPEASCMNVTGRGSIQEQIPILLSVLETHPDRDIQEAYTGICRSVRFLSPSRGSA